MHKHIRFSFLIFIIFIFNACQNRVAHNHNVEFKEDVWKWAEEFQTSVEINDTITTYNIFLTFELTEDFPFSNLYLFINTFLPDNNVLTDTVNCMLFDKHGKWLGKSRFGKIRNKLPYKTNVRFPLSGKYQFEIEQAMRLEDLYGISSCGLLIEEYN